MSPRSEDRHQGDVTDEFWFHSEMKVPLRSINQEEIKLFTLQSDCYPDKKCSLVILSSDQRTSKIVKVEHKLVV